MILSPLNDANGVVPKVRCVFVLRAAHLGSPPPWVKEPDVGAEVTIACTAATAQCQEQGLRNSCCLLGPQYDLVQQLNDGHDMVWVDLDLPVF